MTAFMVAAFLLASPTSATTAIHPDWQTLTDFTATYTSDAHNVLALQHEFRRDSPVKSYREHGTIKADVFGERLSITSAGSLELSNPPGTKEATVSGTSALVFDAPKGIVEFKGNIASVSQTVPPANGGIDFCVRVHFPQGLLPPGQVLEAQFNQMKPRIEQSLAHAPPHQDVTIDGESVAIFQRPSGPNRFAYIGLRHNGVPFGLGVVPPQNGRWDHVYVKFPTWTRGAGTFTEFSCAESASTSVAELVANERAMQDLKMFDSVIENLQAMGEASSVFAHFPSRPSLIFEDAAAMELSFAPKRRTVQQTWSTAAIGGVAGVAGCLAMLIAFKIFAKVSNSRRGEPLLANIL